MKNLITFLLLFSLTILPSLAQYSPNGPNGPVGLPGAQITSLTQSIPATATTINLIAPSTQVTIINSAGGANLHISFNGTATLSNAFIPGGMSYTFTNLQNVSSFSVIGDAMVGSFSVLAHSSTSDTVVYQITSGGGGGAVSSVGLALPTSIFNVTGSPVTTAGTLTGSFISLPANEFLATPSGAAGIMGPRAIALPDLPSGVVTSSGNLSPIFNTSISGQTLNFSLATVPTDGQLLIGNSLTSNYAVGNITGSSVITVTNGNGTITLDCPTCNTTSSNVIDVTAADGTLTISPTTGHVLASIPSSVALPGSPTTTTQSVTDSSTKIATTAFVQSAITQYNPAIAVDVASAVKLPNSPTYNNGVSGIGAFITTATTNTALVVDGYTPALNDRVLVKNEDDSGGLGAAKNGVYYISQLATIGLPWILTRALDYDQASNMNETGVIPVLNNGSTNALTSWLLTSKVTTVGTDALTYTQFAINNAVLTNHSVLLGTGTVAINTVGPGSTSGIALIAQGASADPLFGTVVVAGGGTGATSLTAHGVLIGEGTSPIAASSAGTSGQAFLSGGSSADGAYGDLGVAHGGTGATTLTAHGVLMGETTSAIAASAAGNSGAPFLSGGASADGAYGALNLAGGANVVTGTLPIANGGTNNGSLGVSALGIYNGDGSKIIQTTGTAGQSWRVNAGGTAIEAYTPSGSGTVNSGTAGQMTYYATSSDTVSGNANANISSGALTLGQSGTAGSLVLNGATSGTATIKVPAIAGTGTIFQLPANNGTNTYLLQTDGAGVTSWVAGGSGTVTSVALTTPSGLTVSGGSSQTITSSGTFALGVANPICRFGGDGSDGAITVAANTNYNNGQTNATTFTVNASKTATLNCSDYILNASSTVTINGTIATGSGSGISNGGYYGGYGQSVKPGTPGSGPGGGGAGRQTTIPEGGGGGAGAGNDGGDGGGANGSNVASGYGGRVAFSSGTVAGFVAGSGGGAGGAGSSAGTGGNGAGGGGGVTILAAGAITFGVGSAVNAIGANGANGSVSLGSGGGGGGGGFVRLYSQTSITTANNFSTVDGGNGGNGLGTSSSGGGGGGGGLIVVCSPSNSGGNSYSAAGGTGGTKVSSGVNGSNGSNGNALFITQTPNLPLVSLHTDRRGLFAQIQIARLITNSQTIYWNAREHSSFLSAWYCKPGQFGALETCLLHGNNENIQSLCGLDITPALKHHGSLAPLTVNQSTCVGNFDAGLTGQV